MSRILHSPYQLFGFNCNPLPLSCSLPFAGTSASNIWITTSLSLLCVERLLFLIVAGTFCHQLLSFWTSQSSHRLQIVDGKLYLSLTPSCLVCANTPWKTHPSLRSSVFNGSSNRRCLNTLRTSLCLVVLSSWTTDQTLHALDLALITPDYMDMAVLLCLAYRRKVPQVWKRSGWWHWCCGQVL